MAGQGANSMAIARVACNGSISAAQVHLAAFDLEVRAARESMPAFGPARPAANGIEDGSKGADLATDMRPGSTRHPTRRGPGRRPLAEAQAQVGGAQSLGSIP